MSSFPPRSTASTFYFHDFETGGLNTSYDRAMQFAGIRTDSNLNIIEEPLNIHCKVADDYLPSPEACLVTGISPYECEAKGFSEANFSEMVLQELGRPGTCGVGYNSIKYDDNITRNLLFRTMQDPYKREWFGNNSRWDILPLVRAVFAFKPSILKFPVDENGVANFKLENLAEANNLVKTRAHDALSDVETTIALAKLIKEKAPELFDYYYSLRVKKTVQNKLDLIGNTPVFYVNSGAGQEKGLVSPFMPIVVHPDMPTTYLGIDLSQDLSELINLPAKDLASRIYTREPSEKIPLLKIATNQSPFILPTKMSEELKLERTGLNFDRNVANQNYKEAKGLLDLLRPKLQEIIAHEEKFPMAADPEGKLYEKFTSNTDRSNMERITRLSPQMKIEKCREHRFEDSMQDELLFRYIARSWPEVLNEEEKMRWDSFVKERLLSGGPAKLRTFEDFFKRIEELKVDANEKSLAILNDLEKWGNEKSEKWFPALKRDLNKVKQPSP